MHLDRNGLLLDHELEGLRWVNRPIKIAGRELNALLQNLRNSVLGQKEHPSVFCPVSKLQFNDMFAHCEPVEVNDKTRYVTKQDIDNTNY